MNQLLHRAFLNSRRTRRATVARDEDAWRLLDSSLEEEHRDERVNRERLGETEADDHGDLELREHLRLAAHRLQGALAQEADADARHNGREADSNRKPES